MLRKREGQYPPVNELAELIYHWQKSWPNVRLTKAVIQELYPYIVEKWREGMSLNHIAQTACSCDGKSIDPSPAARRYVARRLAMPPVGAEPGVVFGAESIRDSSNVAKLKTTEEVADLRAKAIWAEVAVLEARLRTGTDKERARLELKKQNLIAATTAQMAIARQANDRLANLEAGRPKPKRTATPKSPSTVAVPKAEKIPKTRKAATEKAATEKAATAKAATEKTAKAETPKIEPAKPVAPPPPLTPAGPPRSTEEVENDLAELFGEDE